ncbi:MarR family transcriptional regulator [bacterium]|nr:MarR family transcriptional regulator [candidate division CSSED10-310 bacterium]
MSRESIQRTVEAIWTLNNRIMHHLRNHACAEVAAIFGSLPPGDLSHRQARMIGVVKELCAEHVEGISLKRLARELRVTTPSASVMVDGLVKSGYLERSISADDRRAVRITLSACVRRHFEVGDHALFSRLADLAVVPPGDLPDRWLSVLEEVNAALGGESGEDDEGMDD